MGKLSVERIVRGRIVRGQIVRGRIVRGRIVRGRIVRGRIVRGRIIRGRIVRSRAILALTGNFLDYTNHNGYLGRYPSKFSHVPNYLCRYLGIQQTEFRLVNK